MRAADYPTDFMMLRIRINRHNIIKIRLLFGCVIDCRPKKESDDRCKVNGFGMIIILHGFLSGMVYRYFFAWCFIYNKTVYFLKCNKDGKYPFPSLLQCLMSEKIFSLDSFGRIGKLWRAPLEADIDSKPHKRLLCRRLRPSGWHFR